MTRRRKHIAFVLLALTALWLLQGDATRSSFSKLSLYQLCQAQSDIIFFNILPERTRASFEHSPAVDVVLPHESPRHADSPATSPPSRVDIPILRLVVGFLYTELTSSAL
jgi:hypothetical protein